MKLFEFKSLLTIATLGLAIGFSSCDKLKELININVPLNANGVDLIIPPAAAGADSATFTYTINIDSLIKSYNSAAGIGNIQTVSVDSITLTLTNADVANNFANIESTYAQFYTDANATPVTFASIATNPDVYSTKLTLAVNSGLDFKTYFSSGTFTFKLYSNLRRSLSHTLTTKADFHFKIKVTL